MKTLLGLCLVAALAGCGGDDTPAGDGPKKPPQTDLWPWLVDQGPPPTGCSPSTCSGCCQNNVCMPGNGTSACGYAGNPCNACTSGEQCQGGICIASTPKCDKTTCATGCCDKGSCKQGNADDACGTDGEACKVCSSDETCVAKACGPKGPAMYKVTLVSAKVTGSAWIVCGFAELSDCDLYVILKVGNVTAQSSIKVDSQNPQWNEYLLTATESALTASFEVEVRDDDPIGSVQIGSCTPKVTSTELGAGQLKVDCGDAKELTFSFQKI